MHLPDIAYDKAYERQKVSLRLCEHLLVKQQTQPNLVFSSSSAVEREFSQYLLPNTPFQSAAHQQMKVVFQNVFADPTKRTIDLIWLLTM
jgi:hypothetical protein